MDEADPRSPLPSLSLRCGNKEKIKRRGETSARVQEGGQNEDGGATAAEVVKEYGLLWRMWRVTKPLVRREWEFVRVTLSPLTQYSSHAARTNARDEFF